MRPVRLVGVKAGRLARNVDGTAVPIRRGAPIALRPVLRTPHRFVLFLLDAPGHFQHQRVVESHDDAARLLPVPPDQPGDGLLDVWARADHAAQGHVRGARRVHADVGHAHSDQDVEMAGAEILDGVATVFLLVGDRQTDQMPWIVLSNPIGAGLGAKLTLDHDDALTIGMDGPGLPPAVQSVDDDRPGYIAGYADPDLVANFLLGVTIEFGFVRLALADNSEWRSRDRAESLERV